MNFSLFHPQKANNSGNRMEKSKWNGTIGVWSVHCHYYHPRKFCGLFYFLQFVYFIWCCFCCAHFKKNLNNFTFIA